MKNFTIYEDGNGGQRLVSSNDIATTNSLAILAYLKMFGGNIEANTKPASDTVELHFDWWGNDKTEQSDTWINSETERTLRGIVLNSKSLETIRQAIEKDIDNLKQYGEVEISINIVSLNRLEIIIETSQGDNLSIIWDNTQKEVIIIR